MSHLIPRRRHAALAAAIGLTTAVVALAGTGVTATAAPADVPSTPVPIGAPDGTVMSYVLNAKVANPGQTRLLERAVADAGGVVVQSWPQIGVVIAHSDRSTFRTVVRDEAGNALESVGATRTVGVSEGTPTACPRHGARARRTTRRAAARTTAATWAASRPQ